MDFGSLDIGSEPAKPAADSTHEFTPMDGDKPFRNGAGEPLVLQVADPSSPRWRRELVKLRLKWPHVVPEGEWTEEELDKATANDEGRQREMLARFVTGWNLQHGKDGEPIEFSVESGAQFFERFPPVAAATMVHIAEVLDASGNVESGSAGGPRKKGGSRAHGKTPAKAGGKR